MISLLVFAFTCYLFYVLALEQNRRSLEGIADNRAELIHAVLAFDKRQSMINANSGLATTLSQLREAQAIVPDFGKTGEFVIAGRRGDAIVFEFDQRFRDGAGPQPVPWDSDKAEPMRLALKGGSGSMVGADYRGVKVLAAYTPIRGTDLGLVAKIDLEEVRQPFIQQSKVLGLTVLLLIVFIALIFDRLTRAMLQKLIASERRLDDAQKLAQLGYWVLDTDAERLEMSDQMYRILGLDRGTFVPTLVNLVSLVPLVDRRLITDALDKLTAGSESQISFELHFEHTDGTQRLVELLGKAEHDRSLGGRRVVGTMLDITERRKVQDTLSLLEEAMQSINDAVLVFDMNGRVLECNRAYLRVTGFSQDEVVGRPLRLGMGGLNAAATMKELSTALRAQGEWQGELWDRRKNGDFYPLDLSITRLHDPQSQPTHAVAVFRDISENRKQKRELEQLAFYDQMTGLPNRRQVIRLLSQRIETVERGRGNVGVCLLDLDGFKLLNTALGRSVGDQVIKAFADRLGHEQRAGDELGRTGADEFVLLINYEGGPQELLGVVESLFTVLQEPYEMDNSQLNLSASAGIACYPTDGATPEELLANAELALEEARATGRADYSLFTDRMKESARLRQQIELEIHEGLKNDEFQVYYQPKLDLETGCLAGAEALLRWVRPDGEVRSPGLFIPVAESSGLIVALGRWVLEQSVAMAVKIREVTGTEFPIAVNLSVRQCLEKNLVEVVEQTIQRAHLSPSLIELEVTESCAAFGLEDLVELLGRLRAIGCPIAVDDFGTGYSSLSYLKRFPLNVLKVDRSFVSGVIEDEGDAEMARAIVLMGKSLGLKIVAEGVETEQQRQFFAGLGCDLVQGYLVSPPLPEDQFLAFVSDYPPERRCLRSVS